MSSPFSPTTDGLPVPRKLPVSTEPRFYCSKTLPSSVLTSPARRACVKCTEGKRKCDKASPQCTRCQRLGFRCSYNTKPGARHTDVANASILAYYLREERFDKLFNLQEVDWRAVFDLYFQTSHYWIGIFNRAKIESVFALTQSSSSRLGRPSAPSSDAALLLICVYINAVNSTHVVSGGVDGRIGCPLYQSVIHKFKALRQHSSPPSIELLQAGVLLAGYEYSHGAYASAYSTLSETAGMAYKRGVGPGQHVEGQDTRVTTAIEEQESRALWWGLFILEQLIRASQYINALPFLMECPPSDALLPPDISPGTNPTVSLDSVSLSTPVHVSLKGFARRAQSAVLLHRALLWEAQRTEPDADGMTRHLRRVSDTRTVEKLDREIRDTLTALMRQTERCEGMCDAYHMCRGAMFILYTPFLFTKEGTTIPSTLPSKQPVYDPSIQIVAEPDEVKALAAVSFAVRFSADLSHTFLELVRENPAHVTY